MKIRDGGTYHPLSVAARRRKLLRKAVSRVDPASDIAFGVAPREISSHSPQVRDCRRLPQLLLPPRSSDS